MTSIRFHFAPPPRGGEHPGRVYLRVIHRRRHKDMRRDYALYAGEWDPVLRSVKLGSVSSSRRLELEQISHSMSRDLERLEQIVSTLTVEGHTTLEEICRRFLEGGAAGSLSVFAEGVCMELHARGRVRTSRACRSAVRSLRGFTGKDPGFGELTPSLMVRYESYLLERGLQMNTVSFYMRNLRALYFRAVDAGLVACGGVNPFRDVFTGVFDTRRRALDQQELNLLASLERRLWCREQPLSPRPGFGGCRGGSGEDLRSLHLQRQALDYFMFAFHSRGMSFVDMAYLKKSEVSCDTILYKRKKTGFFIQVKVTGAMRRIMARFRRQTKGSPYVFPIIHPGAEDPRRQYETGLNRQNRLLKQIGQMAGISKTLSTHVARHTWATLAKRLGYSIPLISEGLGHRDTKVTAVYLASFERSALDELSTRVSRSVRAA